MPNEKRFAALSLLESKKMSDDLVKWLRRGAHCRNLITLGGLQHDQRCLEAADRIEALEAQLATRFGVSQTLISRINTGRIWND